MFKLEGAAKQRKIFSPGREPWEYKTKTASPERATERLMISAARSGLEHPVTINLALTRQAKILLPLRGCRMSKLEVDS
jgi:hypothetical protein